MATLWQGSGKTIATPAAVQNQGCGDARGWAARSRLEAVGQSIEEGATWLREDDGGGLAVHRVGKDSEFAAIVLDQTLQTQAHAAQGDPPLQGELDGAAQRKVLRAAGPRREEEHRWLVRVERARLEAVTEGGHGGARLAQVVCERVDKRVLWGGWERRAPRRPSAIGVAAQVR